MKTILIAVTLFFATGLWAQANASSKPADNTAMQATTPARPGNMNSMMNKCMESMAKQLPEAEKTLADMKAALAEMKNDDPAAKHFAELNVQMWEGEVAHMREMHDAMQQQMKSKPPGRAQRMNAPK